MVLGLSQEEILRYSRHLMIPEVGLEGQRKLKNAAVLIVGSGGLGSPAALYLAAAGVGHIGLVDYDVVELSNLQRQVIHSTETLGKRKVDSARQRLLELNPTIEVEPYDEPFIAQNAPRIAADYQIILDGTDNFPTRYLINDLCALTQKAFVYGAVYRFEGQVGVFDVRHGPCYRCIFAAPPPPELSPTCADAGVFGVLPGIIGLLQAAETIKLILEIGQPLTAKLLFFDALEMRFDTIHAQKNPHCKLCGEHPQITDLIDYSEFCRSALPGSRVVETPLAGEIEPLQLAERLKQGDSIRLIDVRQPLEAKISTLPGAEIIPYEQIAQKIDQFNPQEEIVLFCRTGSRSAWAQRLLKNAGFSNVKNLRGGINAWAREVDASVNQY